jgi:hypothetical protein
MIKIARRRIIRIDGNFANLLDNMRREMQQEHIENISDTILTRKIAKDYEEWLMNKRRKRDSGEGFI